MVTWIGGVLINMRRLNRAGSFLMCRPSLSSRVLRAGDTWSLLYARALLLAAVGEDLLSADARSPLTFFPGTFTTGVYSLLLEFFKRGGERCSLVRCLLGTVDWSPHCASELAGELCSSHLLENADGLGLANMDQYAIVKAWLEPRQEWRKGSPWHRPPVNLDAEVAACESIASLSSASDCDPLEAIAAQVVQRTAFDGAHRRSVSNVLAPTLELLLERWSPLRMARELFLDTCFNLQRIPRSTLRVLRSVITSRDKAQALRGALAEFIAEELWSNRLLSLEVTTANELCGWEEIGASDSGLWSAVLGALTHRLTLLSAVDQFTVHFVDRVVGWLASYSSGTVDEDTGRVEASLASSLERLLVLCLEGGFRPGGTLGEGPLGLRKRGQVGRLALSALHRLDRPDLARLSVFLAGEARP
jgi:hypothetical protein